MAKDVVIFGAGKWGKQAYAYYSQAYNIVGFIDNDERIWQDTVCGVKVYAPSFVAENDCTVVVANEKFEDEIKAQLKSLGCKGVIIFRITDTVEMLDDECDSDDEELIINFDSGLGNQMCQYALYRYFMERGRNVTADLSEYIRPDMMKYELETVFPNIKLKKSSVKKKKEYIKAFISFDEGPNTNATGSGERKSLLDMKYGFVDGYHCSHFYPDAIREVLLKDFAFKTDINDALKSLIFKEKNTNSVAVHVRRTDFLSERYYREIGSLCDIDYYKRAIEYMKNHIDNPTFFFFSDDIEWVEENLKTKNSYFVKSDVFIEDGDVYENWMDMMLMSKCKHNIIPNSTFGWWAAWLNENPDKVVVTPKRFRRTWNYDDWCADEWVRV